MKLKLVLESHQWRTMKMPILSNRHVDFFNLVSVFHTRSGIWQGNFYPLFADLNSYQDIIKKNSNTVLI